MREQNPLWRARHPETRTLTTNVRGWILGRMRYRATQELVPVASPRHGAQYLAMKMGAEVRYHAYNKQPSRFVWLQLHPLGYLTTWLRQPPPGIRDNQEQTRRWRDRRRQLLALREQDTPNRDE